MEQRLRELVERRARGQCEYCCFPAAFSCRPFHCDHVIAQQHGGGAVPENLAWSCNHCNLHKGPNLASIDPITGEMVRLFNPRTDLWNQHFQWHGAVLTGRTPNGRATIFLLDVNDPMVTAIRAALMEEGVYLGLDR